LKADNNELEIIDIFLIIKNYKKRIIIILSLFFFIGGLYAFLSNPWYKATVKIMRSSGKSGSSLNQLANVAALAGFNINKESEDRFALYPEIIKSNFILDRILSNKFKTQKYNEPVTLFEFWGIELDSTNQHKTHKLIEEAKEDLRENYIKAAIDKKIDLLTIEVSVPKDPVLAAELANFIAENLNIYNKHFRNYKATDQKQFIESSIKENKDELEKAERELILFNEKNKDISSTEKKLQYEKLLTEIEVQRKIYIELRNQLEIVKIEEIKETETIDILENAVIPINKFKPKRILLIISFLLIGIVISIASILIEFLMKRESNYIRNTT